MPSTIRWRSGAVATAQVNTFTFAGGTWIVGETITVTIGSKAYVYTIASATVATFLAAFKTAIAALSASVYPEFAEITWTNPTGSTIVGTSATPGKTFTVLIATNSIAGTINGGASSAGTATTASSGPNDVGTAANYSGGVLPASGDTLVIEKTDPSAAMLYSLNALSAVTLAELRVLADAASPFAIGLPDTNVDATAYPEYRPTYFKVGATLCNIGYEAGQGGTGSSRLKIDFSTIQTTCNVASTGSADTASGIEALLIKGTHASNALNVTGPSSVGVAVFGGEVSTLLTLTVAPGAQVRCGAGVTLGTLTLTGGTVELNAAVTTVLQTGGALLVQGTGAITTLTCLAGSVTQLSTGTVTTLITAGAFDTSQDMRTRIITNCTLLAGGSINDPGRSIAYTNGIILSKCGLGDVGLNLGKNVTLTVTYL